MNASSPWYSFVLALVASSLSGVALHAQCALDWQPGQLPGADAAVDESMRWDPDGAGPLTGLGIVGFIEMISFMAFLMVGFYYVIKKGALKWED